MLSALHLKKYVAIIQNMSEGVYETITQYTLTVIKTWAELLWNRVWNPSWLTFALPAMSQDFHEFLFTVLGSYVTVLG